MDATKVGERLKRANQGIAAGFGAAAFLAAYAATAYLDLARLERGEAAALVFCRVPAALYRAVGLVGVMAAFAVVVAVFVGLGVAGVRERLRVALATGPVASVEAR